MAGKCSIQTRGGPGITAAFADHGVGHPRDHRLAPGGQGQLAENPRTTDSRPPPVLLDQRQCQRPVITFANDSRGSGGLGARGGPYRQGRWSRDSHLPTGRFNGFRRGGESRVIKVTRGREAYGGITPADSPQGFQGRLKETMRIGAKDIGSGNPQQMQEGTSGPGWLFEHGRRGLATAKNPSAAPFGHQHRNVRHPRGIKRLNESPGRPQARRAGAGGVEV